MEEEGRARLSWFAGPVAAARTADLRYGEQVFEVRVGLDGVDLAAPSARAEIEARFHARHEALFTYALRDQDVVLSNARLAVTGRLPPVPAAPPAASAGAPPASRRVWLDGWREAPVLDLASLAPGQALAGPALVQSATTTVLLRPGDHARNDARGWLDITIGSTRIPP